MEINLVVKIWIIVNGRRRVHYIKLFSCDRTSRSLELGKAVKALEEKGFMVQTIRRERRKDFNYKLVDLAIGGSVCFNY